MTEHPSAIAIERERENLIALATKIWENPEMGWHETKAVEWTSEYLKNQGFEVEVGAYGMPTAIRAVWGSGKPVVGFCAEYDCLPGLSQKVATEQDPVVPGGIGHGCGHNLLGVGCAAACVGLKAELEAARIPGTIVFYGCPAEEQMLGKGLMARAGAFRECDFTVAWHPKQTSWNTYGNYTSIEGAYFHFKGKTAHAAGFPHEGRSALDAVQLMNIGVEFLREHVTDDVRMHYVITDGGLAPNIVPERASVKYFVRALSRDNVMKTFERVKKCAEGAALMTDTTFSVEPIGGLYPTLQNHVLMDIMQQAREETPRNAYTPEELEFVDRLNRHASTYEPGCSPIDDETRPVGSYNFFGSTDYGDVMHICPGVMLVEATNPSRTANHTWICTASSGSSVGMKGMIRIGKIMALGAFRVMKYPEVLQAAKAEFARETGGKPYVCPLGDDIPWPYPKA